MTTLTLDRPDRLTFPDRGGETLDDLIVDAWEGLATARSIACPVCGGAMAPTTGHGEALATLAGRCHDCGTELS